MDRKKSLWKEGNRSKKGREEWTEKLVCLESGKIRIKRGKFEERGIKIDRERKRENETKRERKKQTEIKIKKHKYKEREREKR